MFIVHDNLISLLSDDDLEDELSVISSSKWTTLLPTLVDDFTTHSNGRLYYPLKWTTLLPTPESHYLRVQS